MRIQTITDNAVKARRFSAYAKLLEARRTVLGAMRELDCDDLRGQHVTAAAVVSFLDDALEGLEER